MLKKEPLQGEEPIRGGDTPSIVQNGYSGKIPMAGIMGLQREASGITHGTATFTLHIRDGQLARYTTDREQSFVPSLEEENGVAQ
jgi:hypothetical protein